MSLAQYNICKEHKIVKSCIIVNVGYTTFFSNLSYFETITVHAPHPPSPHTNLVPVSRTSVF